MAATTPLGNETSSPLQPARVLILFAPTDGELLKELEDHLAPLRRERVIEIWHEGKIAPGADRGATLTQELETAQVLILLLSASFLAGDDRAALMVQFIGKNNSQNLGIIPVLLRPCEWKAAPIAHLQVLPRNGIPVISWTSQHSAWVEVASEVRHAAWALRSRPGHALAEYPPVVSTLSEKRPGARDPSGRPSWSRSLFTVSFVLLLAAMIIAGLPRSCARGYLPAHHSDLRSEPLPGGANEDHPHFLDTSLDAHARVTKGGYKIIPKLTWRGVDHGAAPEQSPEEFAMRAADLGANAIIVPEKKKDPESGEWLTTALLIDGRTGSLVAVIRYSRAQFQGWLHQPSSLSSHAKETVMAIEGYFDFPLRGRKPSGQDALPVQTKNLPVARVEDLDAPRSSKSGYPTGDTRTDPAKEDLPETLTANIIKGGLNLVENATVEGKPPPAAAPQFVSAPTAPALPMVNPELSKPALVASPPADLAIAIKDPSLPLSTKPTADAAHRRSALTPSVVPQLTHGMLKETMQRSESALQRCVQEGWGSTVTIGVTVARSGSVQQVEVLGSFAQTPTGHCLAEQVRKARFPAFTQGDAKLLYWTYQVPITR